MRDTSNDIIAIIPNTEFNNYNQKISIEEIYVKCLQLRLPKIEANEQYTLIDTYAVNEAQCFIIAIEPQPLIAN